MTDKTPAMTELPDGATVLPDGSAFAIASFPLPANHWLYAPREYRDGEEDPIELPSPILSHQAHGDVVRAAIRYAVRGATMCGKEPDFDPDALVQNAMYALCGPFGGAALQSAQPSAAVSDEAARLAEQLSNIANGVRICGVHDRHFVSNRLHEIARAILALRPQALAGEREAFEAWFDDYYDKACAEFGGIDCTDPKGIAEAAWQARASLPTQPAAQATPDQFADASKMVAPVALRSVHLTRDTAGMCVVRINGRVAIRDNGDLIDHTATLEWFADTQQATPEPVGEVPIWNSIQIASWIGSQLMHEPAMFERAAVCKFVRSLGRHPTLLKHSPKDHVPAPGVPEGWRDAFDLAAQMLTWGRDEGLTPEQVNEVDAHAKLMFAMLAAQAKGGDHG